MTLLLLAYIESTGLRYPAPGLCPYLVHEALHFWCRVVATKADVAVIPLPEMYHVIFPAIQHAAELLYATAALFHAVGTEFCSLLAQLLYHLLVLRLCHQCF